MTCPQCGAQAGDTAKFCAECGTRLAVVCTACGAPSSGGRFCSECGTQLSVTPVHDGRDPGIPAPRAESPVTERRVTSLLFADLVGFTALSERRDHEEVRELLSRYFGVARTIVGRYGGTIEKFIGDAVMAVWGVPVAHEDDAERAVRAGLDLVEAVEGMAEEVGAPGLTMRVGVVTGEVAVTLGATGEGMVAGDAVNTAARVQTSASPGEVWADETTRTLAMAAVTFENVGEHALKGKTEPVTLYAARRVVAARGGAQRIDGLEAPFTGHERALRLIKEMFHAAEEEHRARLVSVVGAPGVGKTRIAWEFEKYSDGLSLSVRWHRGRCLAYGEGVAFWAFAEMVRGRVGVMEGDPPTVVVAKLDEALGAYVPQQEERAWLRPRIATLLGAGDAAAPGEAFTRTDLFAAWRVFLEHVSDTGALVVLVFDDVQWGDDGLFDFLEYLLESARFPLFILTLARPEIAEIRPQWGSSRRATPIYLEPLDEEQMAGIVDGLVDGLPADVRGALVQRAEGVPLYAVETVRTLIDRDAVVPRGGRYVLADRDLDVSALGAPASLQALIASRLDALPPAERRAVQDASVLGQSFTAEGLVALSDEPAAVPGVLDALVRKELLRVDDDPRSPERGQYHWVQGLVRTVAYDTLTRRDRKVRHLAAAAYYDGQGDADELAGVVASHYLAAVETAPTDPDAEDLRQRSVRLLEAAAGRARGLGAFAEALRYYESALALVQDETETARLSEAAAEVAISIARFAEALTYALRAREGYLRAGDRVAAARALSRAGECWVSLGEAPRVLAELQPVFEELDGEPGADASVLAIAIVLAQARRALAQPAESARWFERAVSIAEAIADWPRLVRTLSSYGATAASLGRPVLGMALMRAALDLARREHVVGGDVIPLNNLVAMQVYRDLPAALAAGEEGLEVARRVGETGQGVWLAMNLSFALWLAGRWDDLLSLYDEMPHDAVPATQMRAVRCGRVAVLAARGRLTQRELADLAPVTDDVNEQAFGHLLEAIVAMGEGRTSDWAEAAIRGTDLMHTMAGIDDDYSLFWPFGVEGALATGRLDDAERLVQQVSLASPGHVPRYLRAQLPRYEALLAVARGDADGVEDKLRAAADDLRRFGAPYWYARALLDLGEWLLDHGRGDDAAQPLAEARQVFTELGAAPWLARVPQPVETVVSAGAD